MLPIEINIERDVQKHSTDVKTGAASRDEEERADVTPAAEEPARQAIGPDSGQVGCARQNEKCAQERQGSQIHRATRTRKVLAPSCGRGSSDIPR